MGTQGSRGNREASEVESNPARGRARCEDVLAGGLVSIALTPGWSTTDLVAVG
jgi:hypothetical protein